MYYEEGKSVQGLYRLAVKLVPDPVKHYIKRSIRKRTSPVLIAMSQLLLELHIWLNSLTARRAFKALEGQRNLKLHLGCGAEVRPGWVNIDLSIPKSIARSTIGVGTKIINYDLRRKLPLRPGSCEYIYSSHFFEHLDCSTGLALMQDSYHLLKPQGVFRIALPDYRSVFKAYLDEDWMFFELLSKFRLAFSQPFVKSEATVLMDFVNYTVYQHGEHKCAYDVEKLALLLKRIGYSSVIQSSFQEDYDSDDPIRIKYSFYVDAVK